MSRAKLSPLLMRAALLSGMCVATILSAAISAKAEAVGNTAQPTDIYAYAGEDASRTPATTSSNESCFTTNSAVEATRGIRHWHGCR